MNKLTAITEKEGCTTGQLTLAWSMNQGEDIIPIPGTKMIKYLEENMGFLNVKLTQEENKEIRDAVEAAETHGDRYPEIMQKVCFMDTPPLAAES